MQPNHHPRPPRPQPGPLNAEQLTHALTKASNQQLQNLRYMSDTQLRRARQIAYAIEEEIERRHWPGMMIA
jgi:hypothetical protein